MLRARNLDNLYEKRTLHAQYVQNATPFAATLDSSFNRNGGAIEGTTTTGITGGKAAILPGLVAVKLAGETVTVAGATDTERAFGLFANFVGGELDEIGTANDGVSVWRGPGSTFIVSAPAFDGTGLSAAAAAEDGTDEKEVYLRPNDKGQLALRSQSSQTGDAQGDVARLIEYISATEIHIELLV